MDALPGNVNNSTAAPVIRLFGSALSDGASPGRPGRRGRPPARRATDGDVRMGDKEHRAAVEEAVSPSRSSPSRTSAAI